MGQKLSKIKENFIFLVQNCPKHPPKKSQKEKIIFGTFWVILDLKKKAHAFIYICPLAEMSSLNGDAAEQILVLV